MLLPGMPGTLGNAAAPTELKPPVARLATPATALMTAETSAPVAARLSAFSATPAAFAMLV